METVFRKSDENLIWKIFNEAQHLSASEVLSSKRAYFLQKGDSSFDITNSMLTMHSLCESTYPVSNFFCLFDKFQVDVEHQGNLTFSKNENRKVVFLSRDTIFVESPKGYHYFDAHDPDTFSGLQAYLR